MKIAEWKLDDEIKTKTDLVQFLIAATDDTKIKPTKKDIQWLAIVCKDFVRIARLRGWIE